MGTSGHLSLSLSTKSQCQGNFSGRFYLHHALGNFLPLFPGLIITIPSFGVIPHSGMYISPNNNPSSSKDGPMYLSVTNLLLTPYSASELSSDCLGLPFNFCYRLSQPPDCLARRFYLAQCPTFPHALLTVSLLHEVYHSYLVVIKHLPLGSELRSKVYRLLSLGI